MAELIGLNGCKQGDTIALEKDLTRFGRAPDNDVVLEDGSVSGAHCLIRKESEGYVILDLQSSNGTRVNEQDVQEQVMAHRDMIEMGSQLFRFIDLEDEAKDESSSEPPPKKASSPPPRKKQPAPEPPPRREVKSKDESKKKGPARKVRASNVAQVASASDQQSPLARKSPAYTMIAISAISVMTLVMIVYVHLVMK